MAKIPDNLLYTRTHQWAKFADGVVTVGITDFAQEQLGEIVYVELKWDNGLKGDTVTAVKYDAKGEPAPNLCSEDLRGEGIGGLVELDGTDDLALSRTAERRVGLDQP